MSKLRYMLLVLKPRIQAVMGYTSLYLFHRLGIESKRIDKPDILPIRLIQIPTTDLDNLTSRINHLVSFGVTTLLSQQSLSMPIFTGEVIANDQTHRRRDDPKGCHE